MFVLNLYALSWGVFVLALIITVFAFALYADGQDKGENAVNVKLFVLISMMLTTIILWSVEEKEPTVNYKQCLWKADVEYSNGERAAHRASAKEFCKAVFDKT